MRDYREFVINKAIRDERKFSSQTEMLDFIIFDTLLVGNYHIGMGDLGRLVDPSLISSGPFDIRIVCHQQGNLVISVCHDHGFLRITDVVKEEPSRRPLYVFPVDKPEAIQVTTNNNTLQIWSGFNNTNLSMNTSDVFIEGKHWDSKYQFVPSIKINKNEVLDYFLDFLGVKLDQASRALISHDIITSINTGEPLLRMSIRDKRDCARVANQATVSKQMILVGDPSTNNIIAYNLSEESFHKKDDEKDLKFIAMSIRYDDDDTLFSCAMGTQNKGSEGCYYIDDVEVSLTEHKPSLYTHEWFTSEYEYGKIMREHESK